MIQRLEANGVAELEAENEQWEKQHAVFDCEILAKNFTDRHERINKRAL
jgi:hypothetical protein